VRPNGYGIGALSDVVGQEPDCLVARCAATELDEVVEEIILLEWQILKLVLMLHILVPRVFWRCFSAFLVDIHL